MENKENKQERQGLKRKLMSALAMLLVATILMSTTSYAWFVLSTAPEVTGIETQVGANGSLEIALLNTETRTDMSLIRSGLGDSMVANNPKANEAWGNLVNLSYVDYGLNNILLMPTRLNYTGTAEVGYMVDPSGLLAIPTYGYDGRVVDLTDDTISALFAGDEFSFVTGVQDYGVRAIGTSDVLSVQGSSLANAKGNIPTYSKSAKSNAQAVLAENGEAILNIMMNYMSGSTFTDTERDNLHSMLVSLQKSTSDIEAAMRQGLVAYAASEIAEEDTFILAKDQILDSSNALSDLLGGVGGAPDGFTYWVTRLETMKENLDLALNACEALTGGTYTWDQIKEVLNYIMNVDKVLIGEDTFANVDQEALLEAIGKGEEIPMSLTPGSGTFADIADFVGNYGNTMTLMGANIRIETKSAEKPVYLTALSEAVNTLEPADGGQEAVSMPLTSVYGYAIDLAFRCNAPEPDLVLQTAPEQRIYVDSESASTQGGGSYMEFSSADASLTFDQRIKLMDAIRVGFLDDKGEILGIAKLNISNYKAKGELLKAPLELHNYSFSEEDGAMIMGLQKKKDTEIEGPKNLITTLNQNEPKAITVVVWLDGDLVDNTMVSATEAASLGGVLNLQFATTAELVPAADGTLLGYSPDAEGLKAAISMFADEYVTGQVNRTNKSWAAFASAYNRALEVSENDNPSQIEIDNALENLREAYTKLEVVSQDAINEKIAQLREMMGSIPGEVAAYAVRNADGSITTKGNEDHTQEEHDSWDVVAEINRVDYQKNNISGDDQTIKYTDASWNALANALYNAEAVAKNPDATEDQINAAMMAVENAEKALARQVFFKPYEYRGALYYEAICDADNADTYGKWYDGDFNRIVSDLTILNLDAYAEEVDLISMGQESYVASDAKYITPDIAFLEEVYPELRDVQVKGVNWNGVDETLFTELMNQNHFDKLSELVTLADTDPVINGASGASVATFATFAVDNVYFLGETLWTSGQEAPTVETEPGSKWAPVMDEASGSQVTQQGECTENHTHSPFCSVGNMQYKWIVVEDPDYVPDSGASEPTTPSDGKPDYFSTAYSKAKELKDKWLDPTATEDITAKEAEGAIQELNDAIIKRYDENLENLETESTGMSDTQRILLNAAINSAKAIEGYDDSDSITDEAKKAKIQTLVEKTEAAEAILAELEPTKEAATTALSDLNTALKAAGGKEITENNTLTHKLPAGFSAADIVYSVDFPGIRLKLTGTSGKTTIGAAVLTADGVVLNVSKEVTVYDKADGVKIKEGNSVSVGTESPATITAELLYEAGGENTGNKPLDKLTKEEIKSIRWASKNMEVATVEGTQTGKATVTGLTAGSTMITVSVETKSGNFYVLEIPVVVTEGSAPAPEEPEINEPVEPEITDSTEPTT